MEDSIRAWFKNDFTKFDSNEGLNRSNPYELKRLNILIGANNSGKSRFMREFGFQAYIESIDFTPPESYLCIIENLKEFLKEFNQSNSISFPTEWLSDRKQLIAKHEFLIKNLAELKQFYCNQLITNRFTVDYSIDKKSGSELTEKFIKDLENIKYKLDVKPLTNRNVFYISSLRSLRKFSKSEVLDQTKLEALHREKTERLPHLSANADLNRDHKDLHILLTSSPLLFKTYQDYTFLVHQIISGEDFFEFLTDSLLGMPDERKRIEEYQEKLSHYFFNNAPVTLIPHRKDDSLHIKIGKSEQFPISQLGDGLQQIIILTYKAFLTAEPSFFLIEEPEMHLHAGYVKQLMKFLLDETDHYYMATSHSNYLLDMINEDQRITLHRVDKNPDDINQTVIKRCDGDRTILQTLGVSPSSVFLANCTIWVEGITDRLYFVQYLKKYLEELKKMDEAKWKDYSRFIDGYHYAFVEYQGSNLEHWDFNVSSIKEVDSSQDKGLNALLVTSNALVIADADLKKKPRFNELELQLGSKIAITEGKETENTLPKELLVRKFFELCPVNGLANQGNKKKLDYKDDYLRYFSNKYQTASTGIGKYFDSILRTMRKDNILPAIPSDGVSFTFSDGGQGTIKRKTAFCQDIVNLMQTENWELTNSAKVLCEAIFEHISENNP